MRGLKSLGVSTGSYGTLLSSVLMEKLLSELRLIISRAITEDQWDLETLLQIVWNEKLTLEKGQLQYYCSQSHLSTTKDEQGTTHYLHSRYDLHIL